MNKDIIYREDAIKAIKEHHFFINNQCKYPSEGCVEVIEDAINVPSADRPQDDDWEKYSDKLWKNAYERGKADRPQGEWVEDKSKNIWNMVVDCYKCSNCGKKAINHSLILDTTGLDYCPNCGARMKGADDDSDRRN